MEELRTLREIQLYLNFILDLLQSFDHFKDQVQCLPISTPIQVLSSGTTRTNQRFTVFKFRREVEFSIQFTEYGLHAPPDIHTYFLYIEGLDCTVELQFDKDETYKSVFNGDINHIRTLISTITRNSTFLIPSYEAENLQRLKLKLQKQITKQ